MPVRPLTSRDPVQISGYRLPGRLGEGGQGVVYLAEYGSDEQEPGEQSPEAQERPG
ncbi:hypothetical protein SAMN04489712_113145 [Thermomonospora echinospora]|uniref:Serine/threonine protein kinase n=1 Tax=Thermomonospora echinospora TaxID=1992 RepID=A0A1H6D5Z6_9ACTN|nr:hypothetical protein [Thermomonospora echinospora]SEG80750.1 hypothetical protein SAMN04489712_113145 [Thermomonospora echinospora]